MMEFHSEEWIYCSQAVCVAGKTVPARDSTGWVGDSREELVGLLVVRRIELWGLCVRSIGEGVRAQA